jgi:hypothetical protein
MTARTKILETLKSVRPDLERFGVSSLALFGSAARGEDRPDSDVDVLVEFGRPAGLFDFVRVRRRLERALGRRVDLVTPEALRPSMRESILRDAVRAA